jgi:hypothetical protein
MIELSMIRDLVAIFGVIAGFTYYVMTVRINQRAMRINLTNNLVQRFGTEDFITKVTELMYMEWEDYDDFENKYGSDVNRENYNTRMVVWGAFDSLGNLLRTGMADKDILYGSIFTYNSVQVWNKYEDILTINRKLYSGPEGWIGFEYLAEELYKIRLQRDRDWDMKAYSPVYDEEKKILAQQES